MPSQIFVFLYRKNNDLNNNVANFSSTKKGFVELKASHQKKRRSYKVSDHYISRCTLISDILLSAHLFIIFSLYLCRKVPLRYRISCSRESRSRWQHKQFHAKKQFHMIEHMKYIKATQGKSRRREAYRPYHQYP